MTRIEDPHLHDLPDLPDPAPGERDNEMSAGSVVSALGEYTAHHALTESLWLTTERKGEFTIDDWAVSIEGFLKERGFAVLPIPVGKEVW